MYEAVEYGNKTNKTVESRRKKKVLREFFLLNTLTKGRHALGTDFVVPMQNMLDSYTNGYDRKHIQVVATEDSTVVQMTPPP